MSFHKTAFNLMKFGCMRRFSECFEILDGASIPKGIRGDGFKVELKVEQYVGCLLIISFVFFILIGSWLKTVDAYRDLLLTIALVHFVMSKLITIQRNEKEQ